MFENIFAFVIGIICIILGSSNMKGNISSLHSYHRHRVSEKDRIPFGRLVGLGTIIIGCSIIICGVLSSITLLTNINLFISIGNIVLIFGLIVGILLSFYAMIKYNKGIF